MDKRSALIVDALQGRLLQVRTEAKSIQPEAFGEFRDDVAGMADVLVVGKLESTIVLPGHWLAADDNCFTCLKRLGVGETVVTRAAALPTEDLLLRLKSTRKDPHEQFRLLTSHYAFPLNFALSSEELVREYVLGRVMVSYRAGVESGRAVDNENLFLSLNLVAVNALFTADLRYLDALNYFYELPRPTVQMTSPLVVSYMVLYAKALVANITRLG